MKQKKRENATTKSTKCTKKIPFNIKNLNGSANRTIKNYIDKKLNQLQLQSRDSFFSNPCSNFVRCKKSTSHKKFSNKSTASTAISVSSDDKEQMKDFYCSTREENDKLREENEKLKKELEISKKRIEQMDKIIQSFICENAKEEKYKCPIPTPYVKKLSNANDKIIKNKHKRNRVNYDKENYFQIKSLSYDCEII